MAFTTLVSLVHFPMWGSMFLPPSASALQEDVVSPEEKYYTSEYTAEEKERGLDMPAKVFAANTLQERSRHGSNNSLMALGASKHGSSSALQAMGDSSPPATA